MTLSSTWEAQCINKCILLSSKCGSQFGHAALAGATSSLLFWRKGSGHSLWMASSGRFMALLRTSKKEKQK